MSLPSPSYDSTAVVTGASSGIGEEIARELAGRGHGVTLVARRADRLDVLAKELTAKGVRVEVLPADLSDPTARAELLDRIDGLGLEPDILVNNAGFSTLGPVHRADPTPSSTWSKSTSPRWSTCAPASCPAWSNGGAAPSST